MKFCGIVFSFIALIASSAAYAAPSFEGRRVAVPTRGDQSVDIWVETPKAKSPPWVVVLYPGGEGTLGVRDSGPASRDNCPSGYPVKGNQTTRHTSDWIYHVPGGQYYAVTDPEECFATEAAARIWGYRASLR